MNGRLLYVIVPLVAGSELMAQAGAKKPLDARRLQP